MDGPEAQADFLAKFRADSIIEDCEAVSEWWERGWVHYYTITGAVVTIHLEFARVILPFFQRFAVGGRGYGTEAGGQHSRCASTFTLMWK